MITQLLSGQTDLHLGALTPTRDFNYVKDTAKGFIAIAEAAGAVGQEINIASGAEHSIGDIARFLVEQINPAAKIVTDEQRLRPDASEVFRLLGDNSKIKSLTTWRPEHDLHAGLKATIEWFKVPENLARYKAWLYNL